MSSSPAVPDRALGRCARCLRKAFLAAAGAWLIVALAAAARGVDGVVLALALAAIGATALLAAHIAALARRSVSGAIGSGRSPHASLRRAFPRELARAAALAATAAVLAPRAGAQPSTNCGCKIGDIWCDPKTRVTDECQDVNGCTMWIPKGARC